MSRAGGPRVLVIACGALVRELRAVLGQLGLGHGEAGLADGGLHDGLAVDVEYLPSPLHNRPERIPDAVRRVVDERGADYDRVVLGYADCGTGGGLDRLADELDLTRLPGAHCYEFLAGAETFDALQDAEPGTFYLTDYLARYFDPLVIGGLGLDRHPELRDLYFGNYRRLCFLSQTDDPHLTAAAHAAAERLGLEFVHRPTGLAPLAEATSVLVGVPVLVRR